MESRFHAITIQDKESYRNRVTVTYIVHQKPPTAVFYAITILLAAFLWVGAIMNGDRAESMLPVLVYGVLLFFLAIKGAPYLDNFAVKRVSGRILKSTLKSVKDLGTTTEFSFSDGNFTFLSPSAKAQRDYADLTILCETYHYYLLFQGKEYCFTVSKEGIDQGTAVDLKSFLEQKSGCTFQVYPV